MRGVVITGASTGIGLATAVYLAEKGYRIFASVRKREDGERLRRMMGENVVPLLFDVTDEAAIATAVATVTDIQGESGLFGLVNNAGIAVAGPLMHLTAEEARWQMEVNVIGLLNVTRAFLPLLGAVEAPTHPPGRIINVSSVGGRIVYPFMAMYAASKHAVEALTDGLRRELLLFGIDVVSIQPGSVVTPIWDKAEDADVDQFDGTPYGPLLRRFGPAMIRRGKSGMSAEKVAATIHTALTTPSPRTRYVLSENRLQGWLLPRYLPDRWFDRLIARTLGLKAPDAS